MLKRIVMAASLGLLFLEGGSVFGKEGEYLHDPMAPGWREKDEQVVVRKMLGDDPHPLIQMIVYHGDSGKSWVLVNGVRLFEGDRLFGKFILVKIDKDCIVFEDAQKPKGKYRLVMGREQNVKKTVTKGEKH